LTDLSIVVPTYDTADMTLRCCAAVVASMPRDAELIVVDDGSHDGTQELLRSKVPQARVIRLESNSGFAPAANAGIRATTGRIILLLNSDAIVAPDALAALLAAFEDPKTGVAGAQLMNEDGSPQWSGGRTPTLPWMIGVVSGAGRFVGRLRRKRRSAAASGDIDWVSGAAMAFRREVWDAVGPLSERYLFYCQDIEFCLAARDAGWRVRIVQNVRVIHGLGKTVAANATLDHDPERLWPDLLTWGRSYYGKTWAALARVVLVISAWLRVAAQPHRTELKRAARRLSHNVS